MKHAVITTTIHEPQNLDEWGATMSPGDVFVIAGDRGAPHTQISDALDTIYDRYGVETRYVGGHGGAADWAVGPVIGWRSIQRRNIAILEAMTYKPDYITTIDTDNFPSDANHLKNIREIMQTPNHHVVTADLGWFNVGEMLTPPVIHRGYPLSQRRVISDRSWKDRDTNIGVHASLWNGDPDVDAIERIHADPQTQAKGSEFPFVLDRSTWCPFNSQATTYRRELFPLMFVWPFVGRMDDIWPSYVARRIMNNFGYDVAYGEPFVTQERNPHDLVKDLENEIIGYRYTDAFVDGLRMIDLSDCKNVIEALGRCTAKIARQSFIPPPLSLFFDKWHRDLNTLQSHYGVSFE